MAEEHLGSKDCIDSGSVDMVEGEESKQGWWWRRRRFWQWW